MSAFEQATTFFHYCESLKGWLGCADLVAADATFSSQCEPLVDITTVAAYCDWMAGLGLGPLKGCRYHLHASAWDEDTRTALFFASFYGQHSGEGGPVAPTDRSTVSHYVYAITMNNDNKVSHLVKVWNAPWALKELGWTE